MNVCYKCGNEMVTEAYYKVNRHEFKTEPRFNHYEHIIQNALFGRLKPNNILCKQCGNDASTDIDKDFVTLFHFITETIKHMMIKKDHGRGSSNTLNGILYDSKFIQDRDILIRDNVVAPKVPFHKFDIENNKLIIYSIKARAKQYIQQHEETLRKEAEKKEINYDKLEVEFVDDISHLGAVGIFFTEGVENFHKKLVNGFRKIAAGFATYSEVPRDQLKNLLTIGQGGIAEFNDENNVFPFIAVGAIDHLIENNRPKIERHFPAHTLILFSQNFGDVQHLYCYVDLFSTFQYYILLNDDYTGEEIYNNYHQATIEEKKPWLDVSKLSPSEASIVVKDYEIDLSKYKGTSFDEYIKFFQNAVDNYTFRPKLSLENEINLIMDILIRNYNLDSAHIFDALLLQGAKGLTHSDRNDVLMGFKDYLENPHGFQDFRTCHIAKDENGRMVSMSSPSSLGDPFMTKEFMKDYCTLKFYQISDFINANKNDKK